MESEYVFDSLVQDLVGCGFFRDLVKLRFNNQ